MFYIHHSAAISPQQTFGDIDLTRLHEYSENKMRAIEPAYEGIPASLLRRMGKAVKIGVGTSISLLKKNPSVLVYRAEAPVCGEKIFSIHKFFAYIIFM